MTKSFVIFVLVLSTALWATDVSVSLSAEKNSYNAQQVISIQSNLQMDRSDEQVWDTYLYYVDSRNTPIYITTGGNSLQPKALGMLSPTIQLQAANWSKDDKVTVHVCLCEYGTEKVFSKSQVEFEVKAGKVEQQAMPRGAELRLVQETHHINSRSLGQRYSDYKQFDSRWKYEKMGSSTTIGKSGCAMTSAGNIIGWNPHDLNNHLMSKGGYSGNLIIWSSVPYVSYAGQGSISDSLFSSYHVVGYVGGHFVLLTGAAGGGKYYSHDPGKSSNPVYSSSQIYSVRKFRK